MTNALLITILLLVLITTVCTIITTVITAKEAKAEKTVFEILKITGVILLVVAVILTALGVSYIKDDSNNKKQEAVTLETAGFKNISLNEYLDLIKEPEKNIILVARPTCGFCEQFTPVLKQAKEDMGLTIHYVNTDDFSKEDWTTFNSSLSYLNSTEWGTPLVMIVQNGEAIAENQGYVELSTIKEFFESNGFGD